MIFVLDSAFSRNFQQQYRIHQVAHDQRQYFLIKHI